MTPVLCKKHLRYMSFHLAWAFTWLSLANYSSPRFDAKYASPYAARLADRWQSSALTWVWKRLEPEALTGGQH